MLVEAEIFKLFVLVMIRVSGLIVSAPILGARNFPIIAKIGLAGLTAILITPTLSPLAKPLPDSMLALGAIGVGELLIGVMIGFVMTIAFAAVQVGGQIMDLQSGFGMMNVFNPAAETQFPIFGFFLFIIAVFYLLIMNGHHLMIRGLVATYDQIPIGGLVLKPKLLLEARRWGQAMFVDGLMIAAPVAGAMLLAYATMGLLGRVVPQIHLFVVGFPITIALALLLTGMILEFYIILLDGVFHRMFKEVDMLIRGMG